ncbi:hypothetical protein [Pandoraea terrigena]|uniref:hypothetical protein n=1 Tax=Pandoraea terrigena TaxID=2508292 RepID=UPI001583E250|nr:hypothetical protein [Pandoraea terrigena]
MARDFTINVPLAILTAFLVVLWVPKDAPRIASFSRLVQELDLSGVLLFSIALILPMSFLMNLAARTTSLRCPFVIGAVGAFVGCVCLIFVHGESGIHALTIVMISVTASLPIFTLLDRTLPQGHGNNPSLLSNVTKESPVPLSQLDKCPALVVIDLQKGIVSLPLAHPPGDVTGTAARLADAFRERSFPVGSGHGFASAQHGENIPAPW